MLIFINSMQTCKRMEVNGQTHFLCNFSRNLDGCPVINNAFVTTFVLFVILVMLHFPLSAPFRWAESLIFVTLSVTCHLSVLSRRIYFHLRTLSGDFFKTDKCFRCY